MLRQPMYLHYAGIGLLWYGTKLNVLLPAHQMSRGMLLYLDLSKIRY